MSFIRELIQWFIFGAQESAAETVVDSPIEDPSPKQDEDRLYSSDVFKHVKTITHPKDFLNDLKAHIPFARQFRKERESLVRDIKNLHPR